MILNAAVFGVSSSINSNLPALAAAAFAGFAVTFELTEILWVNTYHFIITYQFLDLCQKDGDNSANITKTSSLDININRQANAFDIGGNRL